MLERAAADPRPPEEAYEHLALLELMGHRYEAALRWYDQAHEQDRGSTRLLLFRASARLTWAGELEGRGEDALPALEAALEDTARLLAIDPQDTMEQVRGVIHLRIARQHHNRGRDEEEPSLRAALAEFERRGAGSRTTRSAGAGTGGMRTRGRTRAWSPY
jgi:tetratricopeptide (TPR) repeat protein